MATGTLKMGMPSGGYGFISTTRPATDMFLHIKRLQSAGIAPGCIRKGERLPLTFNAREERPGPPNDSPAGLKAKGKGNGTHERL